MGNSNDPPVDFSNLFLEAFALCLRNQGLPLIFPVKSIKLLFVFEEKADCIAFSIRRRGPGHATRKLERRWVWCGEAGGWVISEVLHFRCMKYGYVHRGESILLISIEFWQILFWVSCFKVSPSASIKVKFYKHLEARRDKGLSPTESSLPSGTSKLHPIRGSVEQCHGRIYFLNIPLNSWNLQYCKYYFLSVETAII